ncbi:glucose-6-phosphate isomerase [Collinsella intestinalis]|uniref:glucose-6-phosphate isomerase n=1 Tax=Collinsella intestinalis TaxID=147207 RepID=UPI001959DFCC|nr:glucose-6-phosphate isomerase [Collinsella intestinalis]MBM6907757.1 glucose-6-phosphate isomerase [Collinsella intestinalis]MBM6942324.1 glucose-6-phosphate isomerase [Collinsella intestinalis]
MLDLNTTYTEKFVASGELAAYAEAHAHVLARCQAGEERYADSQGWLEVDEWAGPAVLDRTERLAAELRAIADTFVIIGVGGSNNSARAVIKALRPNGARIVYAGNTLSAHELNGVLAELEGHDVVIDCIAKNFETLEPGSSFRLLRQYLVGRYGKEEAARRIVCTGTIGSPLEELCRAEGYTFVPFATNVGGRYTALTEVHLLPLAVAGADIRALAAGAKRMQDQLRATDGLENSAWRYACLRNILWDRGYRVELLGFFEPRFRWFSKWWEQLYAESEGKDGKGIFPAALECSEEMHSLGQYAQDGTHQLFETFIDLMEPGAGDSLVLGGTDVADAFGYLDGKDFWDINKASFNATRAAHAEVLPVVTLEIDRIDEEHFGMLFYWFAFACYASGSLLGVNPFDQPGVEAYKRLMFEALGK